MRRGPFADKRIEDKKEPKWIVEKPKKLGVGPWSWLGIVRVLESRSREIAQVGRIGPRFAQVAGDERLSRLSRRRRAFWLRS